MKARGARGAILFLGLTAAMTVAAAAETPANPPDFREIYSLVRSNLAGVTPEQLDEATAEGLTREFPGRVTVVDAVPEAGDALKTALAKTAVYDGAYAYFQVGNVTPDLPGELRQAWKTLAETNKSKIKGVILDLRFAAGGDFTAAGQTADCFLARGEALLEWPGGSVSSIKKEDAIAAPVAVLIDARTSGAAEALGAVLRAADRAITVGTRTAGQASLFKEFPLSNGQKLRIAVADVKLAGGPSVAEGLSPDIPVDSTPAQDRSYLGNPYHEFDAGTNASGEPTNEPLRRFNEAELVREQRAGLNPGEELDATPTAEAEAPGPPIILDPDLARALDLLKGLNVINRSRPG